MGADMIGRGLPELRRFKVYFENLMLGRGKPQSIQQKSRVGVKRKGLPTVTAWSNEVVSVQGVCSRRRG